MLNIKTPLSRSFSHFFPLFFFFFLVNFPCDIYFEMANKNQYNVLVDMDDAAYTQVYR
jgi:hypothetical protein